MVDDIKMLVTSVSFEKSVMPLDSSFEYDAVLDLLQEHAKDLKISGIDSLTSKYQEDGRSAKEKLIQAEKLRSNLRKKLLKLNEDNTAIDKQIHKLKSEIRDANFKINKAKTMSSITDMERQIIEQQELELRAYKCLTGIRFNNNVPDDKLEGLITNSRKNFVKAIQLDKSMPMKKIREVLWSSIKESGLEMWDNIEENKEN